MEQRCKNILQNYLKSKVYNTDYKIIKTNKNFIIKYKCIILFYVYENNIIIKYNISDEIKKGYNHYNFYFYLNNKNNQIYYVKNTKIKIIHNNKEEKYYNTFCKMYKKLITIYSPYIWFMYYYYKIIQYNIYI